MAVRNDSSKRPVPGNCIRLYFRQHAAIQEPRTCHTGDTKCSERGSGRGVVCTLFTHLLCPVTARNTHVSISADENSNAGEDLFAFAAVGLEFDNSRSRNRPFPYLDLNLHIWMSSRPISCLIQAPLISPFSSSAKSSSSGTLRIFCRSASSITRSRNPHL